MCQLTMMMMMMMMMIMTIAHLHQSDADICLSSWRREYMSELHSWKTLRINSSASDSFTFSVAESLVNLGNQA